MENGVYIIASYVLTAVILLFAIVKSAMDFRRARDGKRKSQ